MTRLTSFAALLALTFAVVGCSSASSGGSSSQAGNTGSSSSPSGQYSSYGNTCKAGQWIGNRRSHALHPPGSTSYLPSPRNQVCFSSRSAGEAAGYHVVGSSSSSSSSSRHSRSGSSSGSHTTPVVPGVTVLLGPRSKTHGCQVHGALQDSACTPGAVFKGVTAKRICVLGYSRSVRNVSYDTKRTAYLEYGISHHTTGQYEIDHLVSLELGGANSIANLWPEAASPTPGFHQKDMVENYLHDQVCSGKMNLQQAQHLIATNWLSVYNHMPK